MKWVTLLLLTIVFSGCAHHFRDRQISSVDEKFEEQHERKTFMEPRGGRY